MGIAVLSSQSLGYSGYVLNSLAKQYIIYYILYTVDYSHQGYLLCPFPANNLKKQRIKHIPKIYGS
jgi:hypothetical protein